METRTSKEMGNDMEAGGLSLWLMEHILRITAVKGYILGGERLKDGRGVWDVITSLEYHNLHKRLCRGM